MGKHLDKWILISLAIAIVLMAVSQLTIFHIWGKNRKKFIAMPERQSSQENPE